MKFTKMQGCGNDYVYVNCLEEKVENPSDLARLVSDRHFGIGSDGLILIRPSEQADFQMDMYNADGSRGAMCGNGIRCVGKYVYDFGLTDRTRLKIETGSGIRSLELMVREGKVDAVRVDMGRPEFQPDRVPVKVEGDRVIDHPIRIGDRDYHITAVSMGNPHAVLFWEGVEELNIEEVGPLFERHPLFPDRVNTEFVEVLDEKTIRMRVWERGSGETLACGTGACAAAVAAILNGRVKENQVTVRLLGGDLIIDWDREQDRVYMTGPAAVVFSGEISV